MKTTKNIIFILIIGLSLFISCDKHDSMDNDVIVGQMAPHVYWEVGSSTVTAGNDVPFTVQYYTTSQTLIDHLEVWYSVQKDESRTVNCPWVTTFKYTITSSISTQERASQQISIFQHNSDNWNDSLRAYYFTSTFPTSVTLSSTTWVKPASFAADDSAKMVKYFGSNYMQHFKDSLFNLMKVKDFQNMYLGLNLVDNFKTYIDSVANPNTGGYDYVFPEVSPGNRPVPQILVDLYKTIPFSDLIYNKSNNNYDVEFTRGYTLKPVLKAIDEKGVAGITSINPVISLN
ncbi:conserved hypothetical protein [uncultured Paludibacter sp.]|nr:conserved hypothetical protein [uncultured Paludibacter sp.]